MSLKSSIFNTGNPPGKPPPPRNKKLAPGSSSSARPRPLSPYINGTSKATTPRSSACTTPQPEENNSSAPTSPLNSAAAWDVNELLELFKNDGTLPPILSPTIPEFDLKSEAGDFMSARRQQTDNNVHNNDNDKDNDNTNNSNNNNTHISNSDANTRTDGKIASGSKSTSPQSVSLDRGSESSIRNIGPRPSGSEGSDEEEEEEEEEEEFDENLPVSMLSPTLPAIFDPDRSLKVAPIPRHERDRSAVKEKIRPARPRERNEEPSQSSRAPSSQPTSKPDRRKTTTSRTDSSETNGFNKKSTGNYPPSQANGSKSHASSKEEQEPLLRDKSPPAKVKSPQKSSKGESTTEKKALDTKEEPKPANPPRSTFNSITTKTGVFKWINKSHEPNPKFLVRMVLNNKLKYQRLFGKSLSPLKLSGFGITKQDEGRARDNESVSSSSPRKDTHNTETSLDKKAQANRKNAVDSQSDKTNAIARSASGSSSNSVSHSTENSEDERKIKVQQKSKKVPKIFVHGDASTFVKQQRSKSPEDSTGKAEPSSIAREDSTLSTANTSAETSKEMEDLNQERKRFARYKQAKLKELEEIEKSNKEMEQRLHAREAELKSRSSTLSSNEESGRRSEDRDRDRDRKRSVPPASAQIHGNTTKRAKHRSTFTNQYTQVHHAIQLPDYSHAEAEDVKIKLNDKKKFWQTQARDAQKRVDDLEHAKHATPNDDLLSVVIKIDVILMKMVSCDYDERHKIVSRVLPSERSWMALEKEIGSFISKLRHLIDSTTTGAQVFLQVVKCLMFQTRALVVKRVSQILANVISSYRAKEQGADQTLNLKIIELQVSELGCKRQQEEFFANSQSAYLYDAMEVNFPESWEARLGSWEDVQRDRGRREEFLVSNLKALIGNGFYLPMGVYSNLSEMSDLLFLVTSEFIRNWNKNRDRDRAGSISYRLLSGPSD
ncbi:uncharacterized protein LODBEIA_P05970 [Lodderomyces beijingensis]|uniref:Uncharacterized protein n=1 Tax=Lodderomyces beijingensis TaxID=1775926 RepID=A0ABP0ZDX4_9ASCO